MTRASLLVIAKAPVAGRSKTRLCPPCTPEQAAALAEAALVDTLHAVLGTPAPRRVLVLDGEPGAWLPDGFEVLPQRGRGLEERLAAAFEDAGGSGFLVGMDTPQVTPALLAEGLCAVDAGAAAFGPAGDGGYWGIGLPAPDARVFTGIPMSSSQTGAAQRTRLVQLGYAVEDLPELRDVDTIGDALEVASTAPESRFARAFSVLPVAA